MTLCTSSAEFKAAELRTSCCTGLGLTSPRGTCAVPLSSTAQHAHGKMSNSTRLSFLGGSRQLQSMPSCVPRLLHADLTLPAGQPGRVCHPARAVFLKITQHTAVKSGPDPHGLQNLLSPAAQLFAHNASSEDPTIQRVVELSCAPLLFCSEGCRLSSRAGGHHPCSSAIPWRPS